MKRFVAPAFAMLALACDSPAEPTTQDVDLARAEWLVHRPASYSFRFAQASSWAPMSPFVTLVVTGGVVTAAYDENRKPLAVTRAWTIDSVWTTVLTAKQRGELNSATFSLTGVPLEVDYGFWPADGGVHYSIRSFVPR